MTADSIADRIAAVRAQIAAAAERSGRDASAVTLVAVTKTHPPRLIAAALAAGVHDIGESRVQEAEEKAPYLEDQRSTTRWHLIGHLQRNKARRALALFDMIHSVDSLRLAETLNRLVDEESSVGQRRLPILLQVNVSGEYSKEGFDLRGGVQSSSWADFVATAQSITRLPFLDVQGLMTIAPFSDDIAGVVRPCFRMLRAVRDQLVQQVPTAQWQHLSMGMSGDFTVAIEEGATLVRVGSAIFGAR